MVEPHVDSAGMYLIEFVVRGDSGRQMVEIYVDSDNGVTADQCGDLSRRLAPLLEQHGAIRPDYCLTVSSPGLDRALRFPRQYPKHKGRRLSVRWKEMQRDMQIEAMLESVTESSILLRTEHNEIVTIPFDAILEARVKPQW